MVINKINWEQKDAKLFISSLIFYLICLKHAPYTILNNS